MYLQVKIRKEDQQTQRFLWRGMNRDSPPYQMAMRVMVFGAICSPYEAQEVKNKNAERFLDIHPKAVKAIHKSHYMDDYLDSTDTEDEAVELIRQVAMIHKSGGFSMVNLVSNSPNVLQRIGTFLSESPNMLLDSCHFEKVLGLRWNPVKDVFVFNFNRSRVSEDILVRKRAPTKREFLKIIMSIFDPLGFLTWYSIGAKILLQDIWRARTNWDECINPNCRNKWDRWLDKLDFLQGFEVPRCYSPMIPKCTSVELHLFCDASDRAYAAVAHLRVVGNSEVDVSLIAAKSRVAPLKQISVPRLELQAGVLGCRLARIIRRSYGLSFSKEYFWTDSKTLLHWILHSEARYRMFVAHRLGEILETSNPSQWNWVPGGQNPADDGTKFKSTLSEQWLSGPEFLRQSERYWPVADEKGSYMGDTEELEKLNLVVRLEDIGSSLPDVQRFSSFFRLLRATAWVLRFIKRCKRASFSSEEYACGLSPDELDEAEMMWWKAAQIKDFPNEISDLEESREIKRSSRLLKLCPYLDEHRILRVRGRIEFAPEVSVETKNPVILDSRNLFTILLIYFYHSQANHQGQAYVANELRQKYWILGLRRAVRSSWNRCLKCAKNRAKLLEQPMAPLPGERLNFRNRPFTSTGLDYFGPMILTVKRSIVKRYVALFTCLTTRAVHLELVTDLTTDSTLLAIRRMASRRECPSDIWSDNGTNFRGADRTIRECLRNLDQQKIQDSLTCKKIKWHFLPPNTPHMGGAWERLILSVKRALQITMKSSAPQEDVLTTLLTEAEHLVNSRPLTMVSDDPNDLEALTPNHFLIGTSSGSPTWTLPDGRQGLRKRWQLAQHLADQFWKRWLREYLPSLTQRTKWYRDGKPLKIDQVVFLADPKRHRGEWRPGIIVRLYPGRDGWTRVVDVKTSEGIVKRCVTSLLPLQDE